MDINKLRIIISNYDDQKNPVYGGGGARAIHQVAVHLQKYFDITIMTGRYKRAHDEIIDGIYYKRVGSDLFGPKIGQLIFQSVLPFYVGVRDFDVWIESFTPPFSTTCLQLFTHKPVIGLIHQLSGENMHRKYKIPFHYIERLGLKTYRYFIVLTQSMKTFVAKYNPQSEILVAPNGIDIPARLDSHQNRKQDYILFIGRIEIDQKGLDLLLHAYWLIAPEIKHKLKIAGSGMQSEQFKLRRLVNQYHLEKRVEILGKVTGDSKEKLLQHATCAVVPSRYESFSLSTLELFAHGIPVVTFDLPHLGWVPNDSAVKVPPFDRAKLAGSIQSVCQNQTLQMRLSQNSIKTARQFVWRDIASLYQVFIKHTVKDKNRDAVAIS